MPVLRRTRSLCPECLRPVDACYASEDEAGEAVFLEKSCPEHGAFRAPVWLSGPGLPSFADWSNARSLGRPKIFSGRRAKGCPFDCGLCPEHSQATCCAMVEVTRRCNMNCPLCYASAGGDAPDPDRDAVERQLAALMAAAGPANVQLSGGEPTLRGDLPEIIRRAHAMGFPFVQVNSNGLRLAREQGYARRLKEAGLNLVYLQWDSLRDEVYHVLRGGPYLEDKERAVRNCVEAGLSVLFVATLVRGVNDNEAGDLLRAALSRGPRVRGLHFQPAASFGRYAWEGRNAPRLTLPELMAGLETQTNGLVRVAHLRPPTSEHALCSFNALYRRNGTGGLEPVAGGGSCCAPTPAFTELKAFGGQASEAERTRDFTARHWAGEPTPLPAACAADADGFDRFLAEAGVEQRFTLSAMAFQDAYTLDLDRVRRCHIHIVAPDGRLVPFCACNLTSAGGCAPHRGA